ncbi:hypothetical protein ON010_g2834 [Phytophthora cinnamomi]|nr:hypothetical protein ON010_g2834 [Phytophthora cinnamomi]
MGDKKKPLTVDAIPVAQTDLGCNSLKTIVAASTTVDIAFDMGLSLWRVEVALATQQLLSLGRAYEVHYSLPDVAIGAYRFPDFGLSIAAIANSHLFRVAKTTSKSPFFEVEFTDAVAGRSCVNEPICTFKVDDYLVGIGTEDFLVCPRSLQQVEEDVTAGVGLKQEQSTSSKKTITFRFVRLVASVRDDLRLGHTPGSILRVLDELDASWAHLLSQYELLVRQRQVAVGRLHSSRELLKYVKIMSKETRKTLMEDRKFQFAARFREWYADIKSCTGKDGFVAEDQELQQPVRKVAPRTSTKVSENDCSSKNPPEKSKPTAILRRQNSSGVLRNTSKKRVTFAADVKIPTCPTARRNEVSKAHKPKSLGVEESRAFLLALIGPNKCIVESLQEIVSSSPIMNREFRLAAGLKLQSKLRKSGPSQYDARIRLAHLSFDSTASMGQDAAIDALCELTKAVAEHQNLYSKLLEYLKSEFGFCKANCTRKVKDAVFSYLIEKNIVRLQKRVFGQLDNVVFDVVANIQSLTLARKRGSPLSSTKTEVADALMHFLMELIELHQERLKFKHVKQTQTIHQGRVYNRRGVDDRSQKADFSEKDNLSRRTENSASADRRIPGVRSSRKRQYANSGNERKPSRPRMSYSIVEPETPAEKDGCVLAANVASQFIEDRSGSNPRRDGPPRTEDEVAKAKAQVYQKLLLLLFRDRETVVRTLKGIAWDLSIKCETISLSSGFTVGGRNYTSSRDWFLLQ